MSHKKSSNRRGAQGFLDKVKNPYQRALAWKIAPRERKQPLTKKQESDWLRVADLGAMGMRLDSLGAPYYVVRWVAAPGRTRPLLRQQRFEAAVASLALGPMTNARWRSLRSSTIAVHGKEKLWHPPGQANSAADDADQFEALLALLAKEAA
jgi:hypothetical protein